jgi:hypothetical protein
MDCLKVMDSIFGLMALFLKETLNKGHAMDMAYGEIRNKYTKVIICLIRSMVMEFMIGEMGIYTKAFG